MRLVIKVSFLILDTFTFLTSPMTQFFTPIFDVVFGPSPQDVLPNKMEIYPLFGPLTTCFFSQTHAPFTIVLNKGPDTSSSETVITQTIITEDIINVADTLTGRTFDNGKLVR